MVHLLRAQKRCITGSIFAPKVMRFVAPGLYPAILGSTPSGCIVVTIFCKCNGVSPSGKAQEFDSCISSVRIRVPQWTSSFYYWCVKIYVCYAGKEKIMAKARDEPHID